MSPIQVSLLRHAEVHAFVSLLIQAGLKNSRIILRPFIPIRLTGCGYGMTLPVTVDWKYLACDGKDSYSASFDREMMLQFINYFYDLDCANEVIVVIMQVPGDKYEIVLITVKGNYGLLEASLTKGLLALRQWTKHVELIPA